jgi:dihydroorotate dehydrogenase
MLAETYVRVEGAFDLIGVGGIDSSAAALMKIRAGASLIALYSALVFHGLRLVGRIKSDLSSALRREGLGAIGEMVALDAAAIMAEKWPI